MPSTHSTPIGPAHAVHLGMPHLLVVEDDPDDQELFIEAIDAIGARVRVEFATTAADVLERFAGRGAVLPDLVFLDLNLPGRTGLELLRELRATPWGRGLVVLVYTTSWAEDEIAAAFAAGANAYLIKPLRFQELMDMLQSSLDFWLATSQLPARGRA